MMLLLEWMGYGSPTKRLTLYMRKRGLGEIHNQELACILLCKSAKLPLPSGMSSLRCPSVLPAR